MGIYSKGGDKLALTDKQERFVQELLKGKSQREAFKIAYPNSGKWKDNVVDVKASELLRVGKVSVRYNELHDRLIQESEDECIVSAKEVIRELAAIAFANGATYANVTETPVISTETGEPIYDDDGNIKTEQSVNIVLTDNLTATQKRAITSIKQTRNGIEVSLADKTKALELLGKHLSMFTDKIEHSGGVVILSGSDELAN